MIGNQQIHSSTVRPPRSRIACDQGVQPLANIEKQFIGTAVKSGMQQTLVPTYPMYAHGMQPDLHLTRQQFNTVRYPNQPLVPTSRPAHLNTCIFPSLVPQTGNIYPISTFTPLGGVQGRSSVISQAQSIQNSSPHAHHCGNPVVVAVNQSADIPINGARSVRVSPPRVYPVFVSNLKQWKPVEVFPSDRTLLFNVKESFEMAKTDFDKIWPWIHHVWYKQENKTSEAGVLCKCALAQRNENKERTEKRYGRLKF